MSLVASPASLRSLTCKFPPSLPFKYHETNFISMSQRMESVQ